MKNCDLTALGELLIDFTQCGLSENGMALFERNPGGAPANVACCVSRLGLQAAFIGKIGTDKHGEFLRAVLDKNGVDTSGLISTCDAFTTLAFVELGDGGERTFSFARKPGADTCLTADDVDISIIKASKILHIGSLSMTDEPSRSTTLYAVTKAKEYGVTVSYDPNYRELLWRDRTHAEQEMRSLVPLSDIIKLSSEETELLTGYVSPESASRVLLDSGAAVVLVTLGAQGAIVTTREGTKHVKSDPVMAVDTTGAGDAFLGAFLYQLIKNRPEKLSLSEAAQYVRFANLAAGICVTRRGAINAMPYLSELQ